jgi:hypothetical protein
MAALDGMIENLPDWMRLENLRKPYLVNTWANRLTAIDTILRYGDRTYFDQIQVTENRNDRTDTDLQTAAANKLGL